MFSFLKLAKSTLVRQDYEIKDDELIYKKCHFKFQDKLNNPKDTLFVIAPSRVVLFANKDENNFKRAKFRQMKAILVNFCLVTISFLLLIYLDFDVFSFVLSIVCVVLFVLSLLNLSFLNQQIKALKILLS